MPRQAIISVSFELLHDVLKLPDGVEIDAMFYDPRKNTICLKVQGDRFPQTGENEMIPEGTVWYTEQGTEVRLFDEVLYRQNYGAQFISNRTRNGS